MKSKFLWVTLAVCVCVLMSGDSQKLKRQEKKAIPTAIAILEGCDPIAVHTLGPIKISPARVWLLTHSKYCLGHKDVIAAISISGDHNIDKTLSGAVAKAYIRSLFEKQQYKCSYNVTRVPELNQISDDVVTYMYPFVLECNDTK